MINYLTQYKYYFCKVFYTTGILEHLNFTVTKKQADKTFKIPVMGNAGYTNLSKNYEPWFDKFLKRVLDKPNAVTIDVGVNIGQTILKIASFKKDVTYFGFEPNPTCYAYCRKLLSKNKLNNYTIFPVGLSDKVQLLTLAGDNDYACGGTIVKNFRENKQKYKNEQIVAVIEGDKAIEAERIEKIDFIKADVEGAELEVMKGFEKTIRKYKPVIMLEILPVYDENKPNGRLRKDRQDKLLELMNDYNYSPYLIIEKKLGLKKINCIPVHGDMGRTNYFFIPKGKEQDYADLIRIH